MQAVKLRRGHPGPQLAVQIGACGAPVPVVKPCGIARKAAEGGGEIPARIAGHREPVPLGTGDAGLDLNVGASALLGKEFLPAPSAGTVAPAEDLAVMEKRGGFFKGNGAVFVGGRLPGGLYLFGHLDEKVVGLL